MRSGICPRGTLAALWIQTNSAVEIYPDLLLFMSGRPPTPGAAIPYSGLNIEIRGCFVTKVTGGPKTASQSAIFRQTNRPGRRREHWRHVIVDRRHDIGSRKYILNRRQNTSKRGAHPVHVLFRARGGGSTSVNVGLSIGRPKLSKLVRNRMDARRFGPLSGRTPSLAPVRISDVVGTQRNGQPDQLRWRWALRGLRPRRGPTSQCRRKRTPPQPLMIASRRWILARTSSKAGAGPKIIAVMAA